MTRIDSRRVDRRLVRRLELLRHGLGSPLRRTLDPPRRARAAPGVTAPLVGRGRKRRPAPVDHPPRLHRRAASRPAAPLLVPGVGTPRRRGTDRRRRSATRDRRRRDLQRPGVTAGRTRLVRTGGRSGGPVPRASAGRLGTRTGTRTRRARGLLRSWSSTRMGPAGVSRTVLRHRNGCTRTGTRVRQQLSYRQAPVARAGPSLEPGVGLEPTTYRLQGGCSTS